MVLEKQSANKEIKLQTIYITSSSTFLSSFQSLKESKVSLCMKYPDHEASHVNFPDVLPLKVNLINHLHRRTYTPRYKGDLVGQGIGFRAQKFKILYVVRPRT